MQLLSLLVSGQVNRRCDILINQVLNGFTLVTES